MNKKQSWGKKNKLEKTPNKIEEEHHREKSTSTNNRKNGNEKYLPKKNLKCIKNQGKVSLFD